VKVSIFKDKDLVESLVSFHPFCQQGLAVILVDDAMIMVEKDKLNIRDEDIKLYEPKETSEPLWRFSNKAILDLPSECKASLKANNVIHSDLDAEYVKMVHASLGSPTVSSFKRAMRSGWLGNLPRLTLDMINKNPPYSEATSKGHLDKTRKHLRSTRRKGTTYRQRRGIFNGGVFAETCRQNSAPVTDGKQLPVVIAHSKPAVYFAIHGPGINLDPDDMIPGDRRHHTMFSDNPGRFPITSRTGKEYIMISTYRNYIHYETMKDRSQEEQLASRRRTQRFYEDRGHRPEYIRLDNETSRAMQEFFKAADMGYEYATRNSHETNEAERSIRTAKNHLISTLATTAEEFPLDLWDLAIPQCEITLNLLIPWMLDVNISAYCGLHGKSWNHDKHPLAPMGTKVMIHESKQQRTTWGDKGTPGYYIGPAKDHYRSWDVWCIKTNALRVSNSLDWFPAPYKMPGSNPIDNVLMVLTDVEQALLGLTNATGLPDEHEGRVKGMVRPIRDLISTYQSSVRVTDPYQSSGTIPNITADETGAEPRIQRRSIIEYAREEQGRQDESDEEYMPTSHDVPQRDESETGDTGELNIHKSTRSGVRKNRRNTNPQFAGKANLQNIYKESTDWRDMMEYKPMILAAATVLDEKTGQPLKHRQLKNQPDGAEWLHADHLKFIKLVETTSIMHWIKPWEKPRDRKATYYNPQPERKIKNGELIRRVRGTLGGNQGDPYLGEKSAYVADLITIKILLNLVVSTPSANFMTMDIKDFYLGTTLTRKQYMRIHRNQIPPETIKYFHLEDPTWWQNEHILVEVSKGIYGLPEAGKLAQDRLFNHMKTHGFEPCENTPGLLKHKTRDIKFTLVVDDFGVYYTDKADPTYLQTILEELYVMTVDWTGSKYVGLTIQHDEDNRTISISMPTYIAKAMVRFNINAMTKAVHSPSKYIPMRYHNSSTKPQVTQIDSSNPINVERQKWIQAAVGVILFYARAVDPTMLMAVNKLASRQANPTEEVEDEAKHLLQYAATHPIAITTFRATDMKYRITSDASYNSEAIARSRSGGYHDLVNNVDDPYLEPINGAITCISSLINCIVASVAEAEYASMFINAQVGAIIRMTLEDLGKPQGPTPIYTDNQCAQGIASDTLTLQKSKSMDMRFHWVRDRVRQNQFIVHWKEGKSNIADYFTKFHPPAHHRMTRPYLVSSPKAEVPSKGVLMKALHTLTGKICRYGRAASAHMAVIVY